jgi:hypothetical protein
MIFRFGCLLQKRNDIRAIVIYGKSRELQVLFANGHVVITVLFNRKIARTYWLAKNA